MVLFARRYRRHWRLISILILVAGAVVAFDDPPSAVGPLKGLLQKGTLPPERVESIARTICERGNEHDLAFIFDQTLGTQWSPELRANALGWLAEAADTRKVRPAGELDRIAELLDAKQDDTLRLAATQLAAALTVESAVPALQSLATGKDTPSSLKVAAVDALIAYGGDVAEATATGLLDTAQPLPVRMRGVAALATIDVDRAAASAANVLQACTNADNPAPVVDAFLQLQGGADKLAAALQSNPPQADVALLALRHMYAVGRSDAALDAVLSELAGLNAELPKLTPEQMTELAARAEQQGDAARGEQVFRRADLACFRCHAVSKGGGQIGPDLSPVGASSPGDYLVKSLFDPDAQKKEEFLTRIILTSDGHQFTGIVAERTEEKLTLKTADGKRIEIPAADIEIETEGRSLMPEGLVKFMTDQEVLDLVKFLSQLGKPETPYAIRSKQTVQRWRLLTGAAETLIANTPDDELVGDVVLRDGVWEAAYARVDGALPLSELTFRTGQSVVYVQGEFDVSAAGQVGLRLDSPVAIHGWLDGNSFELTGDDVFEVTPGRHSLTLRVDTSIRANNILRAELYRPTAATAQFQVVDGQ
jgi:putative heme-binding domain-containing protein